MNSSFLAYLSRLRLIDRWALMRNTTAENVLEHSAQVAMIAHVLATVDRTVFGRDVDPDKVATLALYHESAEVLTGDLPTPVKYYDDEMTAAFKRVEHIAEERLLATLPPELRDAYRPFVSQDRNEYAVRLVKQADKLAAYIKCIEETRMGNREFAAALESYKAMFDATDVPCVRYFLENFLPSFGMSLDEIRL